MSLIKDNIIYIIGELISKSIPFILLPYFLRKLGVEGFADLVLYQTSILFIGVFLGMVQSVSISRYYYYYGKRGLNIIILSGFLYSFCVTVFFCIIFSILKMWLINILIITAFTSEALVAQLAVRQCQKKSLSFVLIQISSSLFSVLLMFFIFSFLFPSAENRLWSIFIINLIVVICCFLSLSNLFKPVTLNRLKLGIKYIFFIGLPLIPHLISNYTKGQVDRFFIASIFTKEELSVYVASFQIATGFYIFIQAMNKALQPYYYEQLKKERITVREIKKYTKYSFLLLPILSIIVASIPNWIYVWILDLNNSLIKWFILLFIVGFFLAIPYIIVVNYYFYHAKTKMVSLSTTLSAILYVFLLVLFVKFKTPLIVIPFAFLLSNLFVFLFLYINLPKTENYLNE